MDVIHPGSWEIFISKWEAAHNLVEDAIAGAKIAPPLPVCLLFSETEENNITSLKHIHSRRKISENLIFPLERRKPPVRQRNLIQKKSFVFGLFNIPTSDMKGSQGKLPARPVEGKVYI